MSAAVVERQDNENTVGNLFNLPWLHLTAFRQLCTYIIHAGSGSNIYVSNGGVDARQVASTVLDHTINTNSGHTTTRNTVASASRF